MAQPESKLITPVSFAVDLVLVAAFFLFMFSVLKAHVMSQNPHMVLLWAGLTAACMSGVFWLALQMFRVVRRAQRALKK
jgi:divalent metal cation (Fe/Co/Zn/Cd) transporter